MFYRTYPFLRKSKIKYSYRRFINIPYQPPNNPRGNGPEIWQICITIFIGGTLIDVVSASCVDNGNILKKITSKN